MRIIRFQSGGRVFIGQWVDEQWACRIDGNLTGDLVVTDERLPVDKLLAPLVPTDILCIGLNYRAHAAEGFGKVPANPMLFIKAGNTLANPGDPIRIPHRSNCVDYECELVIVIGRTGKDIPRQQAMDHILGYTAANDVSARDWQLDPDLGGGQFARAKSFDGFCPLGPCIVTRDEIPNPNALRLRTLVNGNVMQDSSTADMIFDVPALIESLSSTMTLRAGAVILTGTPPGVGFARKPPVYLHAGDRVVVEVEKIGRLENPVQQEG
jgi:2-keto-4-pentenoate hydratase/2-oxohepta-3-ene-1,7-dioic acid hydratase in catechol pathway